MDLSWRPPTFDGANQHTKRRPRCVGMYRQNRKTAKAAIERRQHVGQAVGAPDQREDTTGFENSPAGMDPALEGGRRRHMCDLAGLVRRGTVPRGIVDRRVPPTHPPTSND